MLTDPFFGWFILTHKHIVNQPHGYYCSNMDIHTLFQNPPSWRNFQRGRASRRRHHHWLVETLQPVKLNHSLLLLNGQCLIIICHEPNRYSHFKTIFDQNQLAKNDQPIMVCLCLFITHNQNHCESCFTTIELRQPLGKQGNLMQWQPQHSHGVATPKRYPKASR